MRRLEHPFAHGLDDLDGTGKRDQRDLRLLEYRHHGQRCAGGGAADHRHDFVLLDEAGRESARCIGVGAVIVDDELQLLAVHAALGVDVIDVHLERFLFRIAEEGSRTGDRQHGAKFDLGASLPRPDREQNRDDSAYVCVCRHESLSLARSAFFCGRA